jgi:hypothetical protein
MLNAYSISLKGMAKNKETSIHSFDLSQFQTHFLVEDKGSWEMRFYSEKFEETESDEDDVELEDVENFLNQACQAQSSVAQWLAKQDQGLFKKLNQFYEMQLLIQEIGEGNQFTNTFSSDLTLWLNQQKDQVFLDLKGNGVEMDIFIGGLLEGDRYRFAFPSNFLLACGKKGLAIDLYIND